MAYTAEQLDQLRQAILDLSLGKRIARITHNGRTVEYESADLEKLRAMERQVAADVQAQAGRRSRTRYAVTNKGL
ncbi:gpW family head-tail joining protein [Halomonas sp.]|uniref:gpW family head-tail joining protein n=1 Tax=Halomonas sp. TaxID=1486246 RepID=UPI003D0E8372